jgi:hypothetical protein
MACAAVHKLGRKVLAYRRARSGYRCLRAVRLDLGSRVTFLSLG